MPFENSSPSEISLVPVGFVLIPLKFLSIVPVNPSLLKILFTVADAEGSAVKKLKTLPAVEIPAWSSVPDLVISGFMNNVLSWVYFKTFVSLSYEETYACAVPCEVIWVILSPIAGTVVVSPLTEENLNAPREENWFCSKIELAVPIVVGFLTIPICPNLVSVGKSLVESSNLA